MFRALPLAVLFLLAATACADREPTAPAGVPALTKHAPAPVAGAVSVVMSNLHSPRGLEFGPEGALYVAEAGTTTITGPCVAVARGQNCYSGTGGISKLWKGTQERVLDGLPSIFNPATNDIGGPHDVGFHGRGNGYFTIGWGANPSLRAGLGAVGARFGTLNRFNPGNKLEVVADVSAFEQQQNPAGGPLDSNPYGLLVEAGGVFIADAGANALLRVTGGAVSLVATFAPVPVPPAFAPPPVAEAVPTEVHRGPDGALYVSELTGFPFVVGAAAIYRVVPGQAPQPYATGFTTIVDFAWGADGSLYVLEFATAPFLSGPGAVIRVAPGGARTTVTTALSEPAGITVGPDGALYVSNRGATENGEVLRIVP